MPENNPNKDFDAVFYEAFREEEEKLRKYLPSGKNYLFTWQTIQESGHKTPPAKIISTRTQSVFPDSWIDKLEGIITRSTGYDHVRDYFRRTGKSVPAAYLPDYAARAVAEQAMLLWTALLRKLNTQQKSFESFQRDGLTGREVREKTILVIGVGRIGSEIVDIASGLRMKVLGVDIAPRKELEEKYKLQYVPLKTGLKQSDIVVCALPLTSETEGWLDYTVLKEMKKSSVFINIARGEISPASALLKLLNENTLSGVALDVYDCERELAGVLRDGKELKALDGKKFEEVKAVTELMKKENVILTPHNAFNTMESVERKSERTAENLGDFFSKRSFRTPLEY